MSSPDTRLGQVGKLLRDHSPSPDTHRFSAAAIAAVTEGLSGAKTIYNSPHHPDLAQFAGDSGVVYDGRDHAVNLIPQSVRAPQI